MASVKCLLAFVALAMVASPRVEAKLDDFYEICQDLVFKVEWSDKSFDKAKDEFEFGQKILSRLELSRQRKIKRDNLISAWKKVIDGAECSESSFNELVVIAGCMPSAKSLKFFRNAALNYAEKCLTPDYIEKKINLISDGSKGSILAARKFIGPDFLRIYRDNNRDEQPILLKLNGGPHCCEPEQAIPAIIDFIESDLHKSKIDEQKKMLKYLKKNLFKPCNGYKKALNGFLVELWQIEQFMHPQSNTLIQSLSDKSQNDILRYNLCANMEGDSQQKKIAQLVFESLQKKMRSI